MSTMSGAILSWLFCFCFCFFFKVTFLVVATILHSVVSMKPPLLVSYDIKFTSLQFYIEFIVNHHFALGTIADTPSLTLLA